MFFSLCILRKNKNLYPFTSCRMFLTRAIRLFHYFLQEALYSTEVQVDVKNDNHIYNKSEDRLGVRGFRKDRFPCCRWWVKCENNFRSDIFLQMKWGSNEIISCLCEQDNLIVFPAGFYCSWSFCTPSWKVLNQGVHVRINLLDYF